MPGQRTLEPHAFLLTSLAVVLSCSAPATDEESSLPEYSGTPPLVVPGAPPPPAAPGVTSPSGAPSGAAPEAIGNNPGGVPINGGNASGAGSSAGPSATPGAGGSAGSPSTTPDDGTGGSAMPDGAGNGNVPDEVTPPGDVTPPPLDVGSNCTLAGAFFCENFDAAPLGALQGNLNGLQPERSVNIIDEPGRGRVLQALAGPTYDNKSGVFLDLAAPNTSHFGRAFIRVAQFPSAGSDHWVVVEATSSAGGDQVRPVGGQFSRWAPGADGPSAGDWTDWQQSSAETVGGAWECVEWQIDTANGGNDTLLWVNDVEVRPLERGNFRIPAIDQLWFGWVVYQNTEPLMYDVRFDDIVLSSGRVGCD
jgi:hypothetical protein